MARSWQEIQNALKAQRAGMRIMLKHDAVAMVKFRYQGEFISAELLDSVGNPVRQVAEREADSLRHIVVSQLSANPGGPELWQRSAGVLEWLIDGDVTISYRNYPRSDNDLVMGEDLRDVAGRAARPTEDQPDPKAERPRMYA